MAIPTFRGSILAMELYDVCDEIDLAALRGLVSANPSALAFKHATPGYVRFERPPVIEPIGALTLQTGEQFTGTVRFYDYGVIGVLLRCAFSGTLADLQLLASRLLGTGELDRLSNRLVREWITRIRPAMRKPYDDWLTEDYYVFHLESSQMSASELLREHGSMIADLINGEAAPLSESERKETLEDAMSYYPSDLVVAGWNTALIYDTEAGAQSSIHLLEYANSQLLEFRYYDLLLSRELNDVYDFMERRGGPLGGWRKRHAAMRLRSLSLEVGQLAERTTNALKFAGDMFSARLYKMCAAKIGVSEYQALVHDKLRTADELYGFMMEQFHQARGFLLELLVVVILVIELYFAFRGR